MSTVSEYIKLQIAKFELVIEENKPLEIAARSTMALQATRIFVDGRKSDGTKIGQYSTAPPIYVNPKNSPGQSFKPSGSPFSSRKAKKNPKTKWFASYKSYREEIGFESSFVNLVLSNDMASDFRNSSSKEQNDVQPHRIDAHEYQTKFDRQDSVNKMTGHEQRYGIITDLTESELEKFQETIDYELTKIFDA